MTSIPSRRRHAVLRLLAPLAVVGLFAAAVAVLYRTFHDHPWDRLGDDLLALGPAIGLALAATVASYVAMTGYDALALRYVEHRMPYRRYAVASFVSTAFANSLGASVFVGAALRARVYSNWRVPGFAITRIIGFNLVTLSLGVGVLAGGGILARPTEAARALHVPLPVAVVVGVVLSASVLGYLAWAWFGGAALGVRDWRIDRPSPRLAVAQVLLSTVEWMTMAAALYVLLPAEGRIAFLPFAAAFALATAAGLVSNVPGGLGVFESVLLVFLGSSVPPAQLAVALVAYRLVYFVLPLLLAAAVLVGLEARRVTPASGITVLTPSVLAFGVAGVGVVLIARGEVPWAATLPGTSNFAQSIAGLLALFLARGLHRRLYGAWLLTVTLLLGLMILSTARAETGTAIVAGVLVLLLLAGRTAFYRGGPPWAAFVAEPGRLVWLATVACLAALGVWWHDLSGRAERYSTWWAAGLAPDTPHLARIGLLLGTAGLLLGGARMLAPLRPAERAASADVIGRAESIVAREGRVSSHLAFTGDKRLFFAACGGAFLMYQIEGRSWVVMGDPVGDPAAYRELVWSFAEEADRHGGRPVFYCVDGDLAELYRECGLTLVKLGEEAVVPLAEFSLDGKARAGLRYRRNKIAKAGVTFDVVPAEAVDALMPALQEVSDAWLQIRNGREKRFSLGAFDPDYVRRFPVLVARQEGRIVAFGTLWLSGDRSEIQIDLMRRLPDGPRDVMTAMFVECMLWAKGEGVTTFNLGMAPLSGLRDDANAPFWERIGHRMWTYGEQFYNFKGLRMFKEGFDPQWRARYVAAPGGPALPTSMINVATLVGGGMRGILERSS